MTISDLCKELNNWFDKARYFGTFRIVDGEIGLSDMVMDGSLQEGQYFRIVGSVFNDGVYKYPASELHDEVFDGAVWAMAIPPDVMGLIAEINSWIDTYNTEQANSPYQSESFGGYSYTKAGSGSGDANDSSTWMGHFKGRLNKWRKIQ